MIDKMSFQLNGLQPGAIIGIIGGGQLARMLAMAAARLGFKTIVLDPEKESPAAQLCNRHIQADYHDEAALNELVRDCAVVTYEFENVPDEAMSFLARDVDVFPPPEALRISRDRLYEKQFLQDNKLATVPFIPVETSQDLLSAMEQLAGATILKTRQFGYDGKGQISLPHPDQMSEQTEGLALELLRTAPCILEAKCAFEQEISVIAARTRKGTIVAFDLAENLHVNGILKTSTIPANINVNLSQTAINMTTIILEKLNYVGIIAVEFFVTDHALMINEFAPRVHNSGHWTEAACTISQFEQHIRAITGLPLLPGKTA